MSGAEKKGRQPFQPAVDNGPAETPTGSRIACHCRTVFWETLEELHAQGLRQIEDFSQQTLCCTGCGCCRFDIEPWLEQKNAQAG